MKLKPGDLFQHEPTDCFLYRIVSHQWLFTTSWSLVPRVPQHALSFESHARYQPVIDEIFYAYGMDLKLETLKKIPQICSKKPLSCIVDCEGQ